MNSANYFRVALADDAMHYRQPADLRILDATVDFFQQVLTLIDGLSNGQSPSTGFRGLNLRRLMSPLRLSWRVKWFSMIMRRTAFNSIGVR